MTVSVKKNFFIFIAFLSLSNQRQRAALNEELIHGHSRKGLL